MKRIGFMADCSRDAVPTVQTLKTLIGYMSAMGYTYLELYTEDTYTIEGEPYFGYLRGRYTPEEIRELDGYAAERGIELVPCIQTLAHLQQIFRWPRFDAVNDGNGALLPDDEETYALIDKMFAALAGMYRSRRVNIGCDEAFLTGTGRYLEKFGYRDRFQIINCHVKRVAEIAARYGFHCSLWGDMYYRSLFKEGADVEKVLSDMPKNVTLIYWDYGHDVDAVTTDKAYYEERLNNYRKLGCPVEFCGGAWKWTGFAPDNAYSMMTLGPMLEAAKEYGVQEASITGWADDGAEASVFSVLPAMLYFARACRGESVDEPALERAFKKLTGVGFKKFLDIEKINEFIRCERGKASNTDKYFLYNDCFLGVFDGLVRGDESAWYKEVSARLSAGGYGKFSYLFRTMRALADVLEIKAEIGVKTRKAYREKDMAALACLAAQYRETAKRIGRFYERFREQWQRENKPFGFEVHCIRGGGLEKRVLYCARTLEDYCRGKTERIEELEEDILPYPFARGRHCEYLFTGYSRTVTQGIL